MSSLRPRSVAVVLGTRPELIKLAPVIRELGDAAVVVHTGQHYDANLVTPFFEEGGVPEPGVRISIGGLRRGAQIGEATRALDAAFAEVQPDVVVVQGDTNSALAGALAANACEIPLVHIEAGLRSFDRRMPEEHNRVLVDHLSDLLAAPTATNVENLEREGVPVDRIVLTGNTVVEAVQHLLPPPPERARILADHGLEPARYVVSTLHRPENVDDSATLGVVFQQLARVPLPVLLPLHPRTVKRMGQADLTAPDNVRITEPIGYRRFLALFAECAFAISDSGGVQEEASVVKRPVIVVRRSTERPEVLGTFTRLTSPGPAISALASEWSRVLGGLHRDLANLPSPYGPGDAARRSVAAMVTRFG